MSADKKSKCILPPNGGSHSFVWPQRLRFFSRLVINSVWFLYSSLELGIFLEEAHLIFLGVPPPPPPPAHYLSRAYQTQFIYAHFYSFFFPQHGGLRKPLKLIKDFTHICLC